MGWYIEVDDSDLEKAVNNEIPRAIDHAVSETLEDAAEEIFSTTQGIAPVDTGELRDSHSKEIGTNEFTVKASADHASYVEFGTRYMAAQPWFYSNAERISANIHTIIESRLSQYLPK